MGSPLGPTLANILMTELEDDIIRPLITSDKLKFYVRYVDDTLVLAKPEDIPLILDKLNSFHPQIQFTYEEFVNHNDVHFLDIKFDSQGTTIYRKSTHTGQTGIIRASLHGHERLHGFVSLSIVPLRSAVHNNSCN